HRDNHGHLLAHEIGGEPRQSIVSTLGPTIVEGDVLTFDQPRLVESLSNDSNEKSVNGRRAAAEQSDHRKRTPLCPRRERPRCCYAGQTEKFPPPHAHPQ